MPSTIIKRNGERERFKLSKIKDAVKLCAERNGVNLNKYLSTLKDRIPNEWLEDESKEVPVEEIQDWVVKDLRENVSQEIADDYSNYRELHAKIRDSKYNKEFYDTIIELVNGTENDTSKENANKDPRQNYVIRDLMAGETSKKLFKEMVMSPEIRKLEEKGAIHVHDQDYRINGALNNCQLIDMDDIFKNGTVINGKRIETPHSLRTAATIMTQVSLAVSSSSYGGQTVSLQTLAPFVEKSRERYRDMLKDDITDPEQLEKTIETLTEKEIKDSIQILNYQWNSFISTNGQAPFVSVWMHIDPGQPKQIREDSALLIKEMLKQRMEGMKAPNGMKVNPTFPKLLYGLDENNITPDSEYYYLTKLAAECTAKCMVPDYISIKNMKRVKKGGIYPPMGCVDGGETIHIKFRDTRGGMSIRRLPIENAWYLLHQKLDTKIRRIADDYYQELEDVYIYDPHAQDFVKCTRINKNYNPDDWLKIITENNKSLICTSDHPLPVKGKGRVLAKDIHKGDILFRHGTNGKKLIECVVSDVIQTVGTDEWSYDVTTETDMFEVNGFLSYNCRSMLTPYLDENGNHKAWGRCNLGVITLNLPYIALESKDLDDFFARLRKYTTMVCEEQLKYCDRISEQPAARAPILWCYGALGRLPEDAKIGDLIQAHKGYATVSVGFTGLAETVYRFGIEYVSDEGKELGIKIINLINEILNEYKAKSPYDFSIYGTPSESTTTRFAKALKKFKRIPKVNDHSYVTNSCHVPVTYPINCYDKINFEAAFDDLTPGGRITYIEMSDVRKNPDAVLNVMKYIYDNSLYCEINTTSCDVCYKCGYEGEIIMHDDYTYECPNCHNTDIDEMYVCRRLCGYLGSLSNGTSKGRFDDIKDRVKHA